MTALDLDFLAAASCALRAASASASAVGRRMLAWLTSRRSHLSVAGAPKKDAMATRARLRASTKASMRRAVIVAVDAL